jgi:hypothetical protein
MTQITTRTTSGGGATVKNAPLSNAEIDNNFININIDKIEQTDAVSTNTAEKVVRRDGNGDFAAGQVTVTSVKTGAVVYPTQNITQPELSAGTSTDTKFMSSADLYYAAQTSGLRANAEVSKDLTGFVDRSSSTLTFNSTTRTLTITPISACYIYARGRKVEITGPLSYQVPNASTGNWIYVDLTDPANPVLASESTPNFSVGRVYVSYVHWDSINSRAIFAADERHTAARDTTWHASHHRDVGLVWRSGGIASYTLNDAATTTFTLADTTIVIADEDIEHTIAHSATPSGYFQQWLNGAMSYIPVLYYSGTSWVQTTATSSPFIQATGSTAKYNFISGGSGSLADATEGSYISYWIVATNDMLNPIKSIMGRVQHSSVEVAYGEEFTSLGLPFEEMAPLWHVVVNTSSGYANVYKITIAGVRVCLSNKSRSDLGFTPVNHSGLMGLANDDHKQYVHTSIARTISADHTFSGRINFSGTYAVKLPVGNSSERPGTVVGTTAQLGQMRYNTTIGDYEKWNGTSWDTFGAMSNAYFYNDSSINVDLTIPTGKNAMTAGPVTINNGKVVTIPDGSTWTIV